VRRVELFLKISYSHTLSKLADDPSTYRLNYMDGSGSFPNDFGPSDDQKRRDSACTDSNRIWRD
jgi:hypothetical protein